MRKKFNADQALAALELDQLVTEWCHDIDATGGLNATDYFTADCVVQAGATSFIGHDGLKAYYAKRLEDIRQFQEGGVRTSRHCFTNMRYTFENKDRVTLNFTIFTFAAGGKPIVMNATVPAAVSDARFECRRDADGFWRVFEFTSSPMFMSLDDFAQKLLMKK